MAETVEGRQTTASNASEVGSSNCQRQGHAGVGDSFLPVSTDPEAPSDSGSGENNVEDTETEEITSDNGAESCLLDGNDLSALPKNRAWRPSEDRKLQELVAKHGASNWSKLAEQIPGRSGKSCRLRWYNQLSPEVKQSPFSDWEDAVIIKSHLRYGNKWSHISKLIPGRTDNAVKNRWNCKLKRRLAAGAVKGYYSTSSLTLEQVLKAAGKPPPDPGQIPSHQTYPPHAWALPQSSADGFQAIIIPNSTGAFLGQPFALAHITSLAGVSVALPATRSQLLGIHRVHSAPHIAGQAQGHVVSAPFVVATTQAAEWPQLPPAVVTRLQQPALQQYRYPVLSADAVIPEHGHGTWQPKNVAAASTLPQQPGLQQLERAGLSAGLALQQQTLSASLPPQQLTPPPSDTAPRSVEIPSLQPTGNKESAMLKAPALIPSPEAEPRLDCCEVQDDLLELLSSSPLPAAADSAHSFSNLNTLPSGKILCESIDVIDMSMPSEACLDEEALIHGIWPVDLLDSQDMEVDDFHERPSASLTSEDSSTLSFLFQ